MSRTTGILLVILLQSSGLYAWVNVDLAWPFTLYRNYRHIQTVTAANVDAIKRAETLLKAEFGENNGLNYSLSIDLEGVQTMKIQAHRECGNPDGARFLEAAIKRVHEVGLGWPDKVEYLYGCNFSKPPSFNTTPQAMMQTLEQRAVEHSMCRDLSWGSWTIEKRTASRSARVVDGAVAMNLFLDDDGNVVKAQWKPEWDVYNNVEQHRLMLCMTYALLRTVEPEWTDEQVKAGWHDIWRSTAGPDSARVGRYTADTLSKPLQMTVYPTQ